MFRVPSASERRRPGACCCALALLVAHAPAARGQTPESPEKAECLSAYVDAQARRQEGRLLAAREAMVVCAREMCPAQLMKDCVGWLTEVDAAIPTVVLAARGQRGEERLDVRVELDGKPFMEQLDGKARAIDPGVHVFRFVAPGPREVVLRVAIRAGEKNRKLVGSFERPASATPDGSVGERPVPPLAIGLAALGAVGLAGFATFGLLGRYGDPGIDTLEGCKPDCSRDDVAAVNRNLVIADVSLAVGVLAFGAAVVVFATRPTRPRSATAVRRGWWSPGRAVF